MITKYFTLLAQITYPGPAGPTYCTRTCTIPNFSCEFAQDDPDDEDSIWEQTLIELFFHRLKMDELENFLGCSRKKYLEGKGCSRKKYLEGKAGINEEANKLKRLNECDDIVELYRVRFNATDIVITILEHKIDTSNEHEPETEDLLEEYHHNLKPLY